MGEENLSGQITWSIDLNDAIYQSNLMTDQQNNKAFQPIVVELDDCEDKPEDLEISFEEEGMIHHEFGEGMLLSTPEERYMQSPLSERFFFRKNSDSGFL